ncbi:hypothetical protein C4564_04920 [Candidatus Microgenomates bacterium]|nr:MAG: hypothetical protein C4564_04920 [Candidatus Microgenomates bacterium]
MFYDPISKDFARRILAELLKDVRRLDLEAWYRNDGQSLSLIRDDAQKTTGDWAARLTLIADLADVLFWGSLDVAAWSLGVEFDATQLDADHDVGIGWNMRGQSVGHMELGGVHFADVSRFGTTVKTALVPGATDLKTLSPVLREIAEMREETVYCSWTVHKHLQDIVFACAPDGAFRIIAFETAAASQQIEDSMKSFIAFLGEAKK